MLGLLSIVLLTCREKVDEVHKSFISERVRFDGVTIPAVLTFHRHRRVIDVDNFQRAATLGGVACLILNEVGCHAHGFAWA